MGMGLSMSGERDTTWSVPTDGHSRTLSERSPITCRLIISVEREHVYGQIISSSLPAKRTFFSAQDWQP